jgi:hypothetical protein
MVDTNLPSNETARLLILKQTKIIHSNRKDSEFDRFASLTKRVLSVKFLKFLLFAYLIRFVVFRFLTLLLVLLIWRSNG